MDPRIDPCGTPCFTFSQVDSILLLWLKITFWYLPFKYDFTKFKTPHLSISAHIL